MGLSRTTAVLCAGLLGTGLVGAGGPAAPAATAVVPCSAGLVALTFDDGPRVPFTPNLLTLLHERRVPATFFVVGARVRTSPAVTHRMSRLGFTVGNHTFGHENLTRLTNAQIRSTLRRTNTAVRDAGAAPSRLMRPPYGAIDRRVRVVVRDLGLVPVLWSVDPRDWAGKTPGAITSSTLAQLRPHEPNVVLLHDGVANSGNTVRAVPAIIRGARLRGYCFADLDGGGRPRPPVPLARVSDARVVETAGGSVLAATVRLDRPTSRPTSVRVRSVGLTATAGDDYVEVDVRLRFPVGTTRRVVRIRVLDDLLDEPEERLELRLSGPRGLRITDGTGIGVIVDDDPTPPDPTPTEPTPTGPVPTAPLPDGEAAQPVT